MYPSLKKKECFQVVGRLGMKMMKIVGESYEKVGMAISMMAKRADIYKRGL